MSAQVGDAINLENIPDNSFDVVLHLGPMYHLSKDERELACKEAARVCKDDGILAFAYIVSIGTYAGACVLDSNTYPNELTNDYVLNKTVQLAPFGKPHCVLIVAAATVFLITGRSPHPDARS